MATCEEDKLLPNSPTESAPVSENHSHVSSSSYFMIDPFTDQPLDQSLVEDFQRVTVDVEEIDNAEKNNTLEQDCYFHRTGSCKFGANCKFNHSGEKAYEAVKESERGGQREQLECKFYLTTEGCKYGKSCRFSHSKESPEILLQEPNHTGAPLRLELQGKKKETDGFVGQTMHIECKYYLTTGGCRFGKACRYNHSKEKTKANLPELNFLGLPMRSQEKECEFYTRTGTCGYGVTCRFHHPDPVAPDVSNSFNSTCSGTGGHSFGDCNRQSKTSQSTWPLVQDAAPFSSDKKPIKTLPCLDNQPRLAPVMHSLPDQVLLEHEPRHHQSMGSSAPDVAPCSLDKISIKTLTDLDDHPHHAPEIYSLPKQARLKCEWSHHLDLLEIIIGNPKLRSAGSSVPDATPFSLDKMPIKTLPRLDSWMMTHLMLLGCIPYQNKDSENLNVVPYSSSFVNFRASTYPREKTRNRSSSLIQNNWITPGHVSTHNQEQIQDEVFPERPGQPECNHFMRTGKCKYKSACRYDHPKFHASKFPVSAFENNWMKPAHVSVNTQEQIQDEEFPEQQDQPERSHFMRTGNRKYKSACRYDHPKDQASRFSAAITLSSKGLPRRPGKRICWHYEQFGICKYGPGCLQDHPEN